MSDVVQDSDIGRRRRDRAVDALERIDGVVAATVQLGAGTRIDTVRLATGNDAKPDYVRERAIVILRELGFDIDHPAVLVAPLTPQGAPADPSTSPAAVPDRPVQQPPPSSPAGPPDFDEVDDSADAFADAKAPPPAWHGRFLVLDGVDVRRSEARVTCTVRLKRLGDSFSAEVQELDTPQGRARAAARAALLAAEKSGEGVGLSLEGVVLQEFFGRQYVIAFVDGIAHRRFASLSGILAVEQSLETAAALAILRAVERWVAW
ncbi:MAG TPA: hypothetical protein VMN78_02525 [Longimicrobiales bacterium]|nr:hypothetical protein [Longimicrobiales bacterium]